jgi:hypothetical protein
MANRALDMISDWKDQPKKITEKLIDEHGQPDEVTTQRLVWHHNGDWKRTEVINEEIPHRFPKPHHDSVLQTIPYRVPPEACSKLAQYDGSVVVERTRGELAARCDDETANYLALNLAHEIISGKRSVDEARRFYAETVRDKKHREYLDGFLFAIPSGEQGDPDEQVST